MTLRRFNCIIIDTVRLKINISIMIIIMHFYSTSSDTLELLHKRQEAIFSSVRVGNEAEF